jgi:hypothetical protein
MKKLHKLTLLLAGAFVMGGLASCGAEAPEAVPEETAEAEEAKAPIKSLKISNDQEVSNYIKNQSYDADAALALDLRPTVALDTKSRGVESEGRLIVTRKQLKKALNGTGSMHALEQSEQLFPGQLLIADEGLVNGSPTTMQNLSRGKGTFEVVLPGLYDSEFTAASTKRTQVRNGIAQKVEEWASSPKKKKLTAKESFTITQAFDQRQLGLSVGFEIADKLNIKADYTQNVEKNVFIVSYEQIFYTVNTSLENDTIVFADGVTKAEVEAEVANKPLVMITQASYGKMIFFKVETDKSKDEVTAAFKYAGSVDVDAKASFQKTLQNCNITYLVYGGAVAEGQDPESPTPTELTDTADSTKADTIKALLSTNLASNSSEVENAVMLSYKTSWLKNNKTAKINATAEYVETTREVIGEQTVEVKNCGAYEVGEWKVGGRKVTVDESTGELSFGNFVTIETGRHICAPQNRIYKIPATYGRLEFFYDITWGSKQNYQRIAPSKDFLANAKIETCGTTLINHIWFHVDGNSRKV